MLERFLGVVHAQLPGSISAVACLLYIVPYDIINDLAGLAASNQPRCIFSGSWCSFLRVCKEVMVVPFADL